jgi:hypothetical protein
VKPINRGKLKLRNIWELTLQGNIIDIELAISEALEASETIEKEFNRLFHQFPNCRLISQLR